jgi:hypothetical protein
MHGRYTTETSVGAGKSLNYCGDFSVGIRDADFQVIPTAWVLAAEVRWKPDGGKGLSMIAMALDPAGAGRDSAELARRYGGWYAELISAKGSETADGSATAATVVKHGLDNAPIVRSASPATIFWPITFPPADRACRLSLDALNARLAAQGGFGRLSGATGNLLLDASRHLHRPGPGAGRAQSALRSQLPDLSRTPHGWAAACRLQHQPAGAGAMTYLAQLRARRGSNMLTPGPLKRSKG